MLYQEHWSSTSRSPKLRSQITINTNLSYMNRQQQMNQHWTWLPFVRVQTLKKNGKLEIQMPPVYISSYSKYPLWKTKLEMFMRSKCRPLSPADPPHTEPPTELTAQGFMLRQCYGNWIQEPHVTPGALISLFDQLSKLIASIPNTLFFVYTKRQLNDQPEL